ncbi:MAG: DUF4364 family protein [Oscillospiraceae bacterium]
MPHDSFTEGVKPGGLTKGPEIRILLCYLLDTINAPVSRLQIEDALLGEELVNYFVMAEGLSLLKQQGLISGDDNGYSITPAGRVVGQTLAIDVPRSVRETAVRGVIRAQQFAINQASHQCEVVETDSGRNVHCSIAEVSGPLFQMDLYMPDELSAEAVKKKFIESGDEVYALVLAALTGNRQLAEKSLKKLK